MGMSFANVRAKFWWRIPFFNQRTYIACVLFNRKQNNSCRENLRLAYMVCIYRPIAIEAEYYLKIFINLRGTRGHNETTQEGESGQNSIIAHEIDQNSFVWYDRIERGENEALTFENWGHANSTNNGILICFCWFALKGVDCLKFISS